MAVGGVVALLGVRLAVPEAPTRTGTCAESSAFSSKQRPTNGYGVGHQWGIMGSNDQFVGGVRARCGHRGPGQPQAISVGPGR